MASKKIRVVIPDELSGIVQHHYDSYIADESLSDIELLLTCIHILESNNKSTGISQIECRELFTSLGRKENNFGVAIHRAKKDSLISEQNKLLFFLSRGLKKLRQLIGKIEKSPVYIIKAGQNFSAVKTFEEFLSNYLNEDEILLCDTHISPETLFPFNNLRKLKSFKILTTEVHDSEKFNSYCSKMKKEMKITIEIKKSNKIHERFILIGDTCWSIGHSIKDLGNKDTVIKDISEVVSSMRELFEERWKESV